MHDNYEDIRGRIAEEPAWYDENGCPRYGEFTPERCPDIYSNVVVLMEIACQHCRGVFWVEMAAGWLTKQLHPPRKWHYGDPPAHGCTGDTMNCEDVSVLQAWHRESGGSEWQRRSDLEGECD